MYGFYEDIRLNELISIIIPVYNVENYIVDTCESVFAQTYRNWELLLVEDGSRDSSAEVIENLIRERNDDRIRLIRQPENLGAAEARNRGSIYCLSGCRRYLDA